MANSLYARLPDLLRSLASLIETLSTDMELLQASLCDRASKDPQSSTNHFIKLPNELVLEIINLCQTRKALSCVNKQLRSLTIPYIFRRMRKWINEDKLFDSLQVIEKNPTILSAVQCVAALTFYPNKSILIFADISLFHPTAPTDLHPAGTFLTPPVVPVLQQPLLCWQPFCKR